MTTQTLHANPGAARGNRVVLLVLVLSFLLPFVAGHLAYHQGWFSGMATRNHGQLLTPPVALASLALRRSDGKPADLATLERRWALVFIASSRCETACRNTLYQMRQVRQASGADQDRVQLWVVQTTADPDLERLLDREFGRARRFQGQANRLDSALQAAAASASQAGRLYIMDPKGFVMLSYPAMPDPKASVLQAKDVLEDLKLMLGNSQIG